MLVIFRCAFKVVDLPRVIDIDRINDVALFIKGKAAVATHAFPPSLDLL
jgi:hypothetical protein